MPLRASIPGATRGVAAAVAVALALRLPGMLTPLHDYDEGVYWASLRSLDDGHRLVGSVYSSQPPGFLLGALPAYLLGGHGLDGARAGVVLLSLLGVVAGAVAAGAVAGRGAAIVAALLLAVDPIVLRQGAILQAEAPAAGLALAAVAAATVSRLRTASRPDGAALIAAGGAGVLLALAILTKLLALAAVLPVAVLLLVGPAPAALRRGIAAAGGGLATAAAVLGPILGRGDGRALVDQSIGLHLGSHAIDEGGLRESALALGLEAPLVALAVVGAVAAWRRGGAHPQLRVTTAALVAWALAGLAELPFQHPLWPHHLVAVTPALCLCAALGAQRRAAAPSRGLVVWAVGLAAVAAAGGIALGVLLHTAGDQTGSPAQRARLAAAVPPGSTIVTDDQAAAAATDLEIPPELVDTSLVRILSGDLSAQRVEAIVERDHVAGICFATTRLDHLVGLRAWAEAHLPHRVDLGDGATLYLRE